MVEFLSYLANETKVGERTARLSLAHLRRIGIWLAERYQAPLLEATTRDLRQYKAELAERQKPASVNAAITALRRFFCWAGEADRIAKKPAEHLTDVACQFARFGSDDVRSIFDAGGAAPPSQVVVDERAPTAELPSVPRRELTGYR